jgi:hypothetical protein
LAYYDQSTDNLKFGNLQSAIDTRQSQDPPATARWY